MNSAIFPCLLKVNYFDFLATRAGGFDLSLIINMLTILGTSVYNHQIESL